MNLKPGIHNDLADKRRYCHGPAPGTRHKGSTKLDMQCMVVELPLGRAIGGAQ